MTRLSQQSPQWMFYLAVGGLFGAVVLRTLIKYRADSQLGMALGLLALWLVLFVGERLNAGRWPRAFVVFWAIQSALTVAVLFTTGAEDYFAVLFGILSMQVALRLTVQQAVLWIGAFALLMVAPMISTYGTFGGLAFVFIYTGGSGLLASYALTLRRAQEAQSRNQRLVGQLQASNQQLQAYAQRSERLIKSRERHHLARELHDSATQTIFSMTLTTQSALLLLAREPDRVGAQLDRLTQLAHSALSEIQTLITELRPEAVAEAGLAAAVRDQLAGRYLPEGLAVSVDVEGEQRLTPSEEQGLFRIIQEALNNVAKHSRSSYANVQLHLTDPLWIEITDHGQGFDLQTRSSPGGVGLAGMRERAAEIGWELRIESSSNAGTRIRVEKRNSGGKAAR